MSRWNQWVGLPYERRGRGPGAYDCWGLYSAFNLEVLGRVVPDPHYADRRDEPDAWDSLRMVQVEDPELGDAVLFRAGRGLHVGCALGTSDMLHVEDEACSVIERWDCTRWRSRLLGMFRPHA